MDDPADAPVRGRYGKAESRRSNGMDQAYEQHPEPCRRDDSARIDLRRIGQRRRSGGTTLQSRAELFIKNKKIARKGLFSAIGRNQAFPYLYKDYPVVFLRYTPFRLYR